MKAESWRKRKISSNIDDAKNFGKSGIFHNNGLIIRIVIIRIENDRIVKVRIVTNRDLSDD